MRRILLVVIICMCFLFGPVGALSNTFQNYKDLLNQQVVGSGTAEWVTTDGGNNYFCVRDADNGHCSGTYGYGGGQGIATVMNPEPLTQMTYAAATMIAICSAYDNIHGVMLYTTPAVRLYNAAGGEIYSTTFTFGAYDRIEVVMEGTIAHIYRNGVLQTESGNLGTIPSYIGWSYVPSSWYYGYGCAGASYDDMIWGATTSSGEYIFGAPAKNYFLLKDLLNPAASGFYRASSDPNGSPTLISSASFSATYGKGTGANESILLKNNINSLNYQNKTVSAYAGLLTWDVAAFLASGAPTGMYDLTATGTIETDSIWYVNGGAGLSFDKSLYGARDLATLTATVSSNYADPDRFLYKMIIRDVYGIEVYNAPVTLSSGSTPTGVAQYTFKTSDNPGVYYGIFYALKIDDGSELVLNYAVTELSQYFTVDGYVMNAQTGAVLSGANVTLTQGSTVVSNTTIGNGYYFSQNWLAGPVINITSSKTGYVTSSIYPIPLETKALHINLSVVPTTVSKSGIAIGGIVREETYFNPVVGAIVTGYNSSYNTTVNTTTNIAGFYLLDNLLNYVQYDIWGSKVGFENSSVYLVTAVGA